MYISGIWRSLEQKHIGLTLGNDTNPHLETLRYNSVQEKIIAECTSLGIYQEYTLHEAFLLVEQILKADIVSGFCGGVYIYLKDRKNGIPQKISLYSFNGTIQNMIYDVYPGALLPLGRGIICK